MVVYAPAVIYARFINYTKEIKMKTAVIYARYSSERQSEQSIDGQLRKCYEYAEQNGILVLDTYIDKAMTGTNDKRADFQRMLKDSNKKLWNYVIVYKIDRFGRNKYEIAMNCNSKLMQQSTQNKTNISLKYLFNRKCFFPFPIQLHALLYFPPVGFE